MEKEQINIFLCKIYNSMTDKTFFTQVASEKLHELMKNELNNKLNNMNNNFEEIVRIRETELIWGVLHKIDEQIKSCDNFFASATIKFRGDWKFIEYIKQANALAVKINPIKDEELKLSFDWGQLVVEIYYFEEH